MWLLEKAFLAAWPMSRLAACPLGALVRLRAVQQAKSRMCVSRVGGTSLLFPMCAHWPHLLEAVLFRNLMVAVSICSYMLIIWAHPIIMMST